ncbi:hypothetical protein SteCoe_24828 [Stentor coeruleus]|uniref:Uncharacterized protein n=1 Tax=Stentor coeruleus TaxID=5963 RepID=A0A1R2BGN6_9CILI|nr:hypothetical protein SteCoe_24828 [Stentor coeruleus]
MDSKDELKFHSFFYIDGEKIRLTAELIPGELQQLDICAVVLSSQTVYRGFMTDEMCDVVAVLEMMKINKARLSLVEEGLLVRCSPVKILLTPAEAEELDFNDLRIELLEESLEEAQQKIKELTIKVKTLENKQEVNVNSGDSNSEFLTYHVWPKPRMLLAIVSRMLKEGLLNPEQKGKLKDLILEGDTKMMQYLQQYEMDGNRRLLYSSFLKLAS